MSKKSKKKKSAAKKHEPKKKSHKKTVITLIAVALVIALGACAIAFAVNRYNTSVAAQLTDTQWIPSGAKNASGDEVEMAEVYNSKYTSYQGSLAFTDDGKFSLWLSPGQADDGTHSGTYTIADDDTINALFDEGTQTEFTINRNGNEVDSISLNYDGYEVTFQKINE